MVERPEDLDCCDNSCQFGGRGKGGMRTNGGCRCVENLLDELATLKARIKELEADSDVWEKDTLIQLTVETAKLKAQIAALEKELFDKALTSAQLRQCLDEKLAELRCTKQQNEALAKERDSAWVRFAAVESHAEFLARLDAVLLELAHAKQREARLVEEIKNEPECPGDMPDEMYAAMCSAKDIAEEAIRIAVRKTKENILAVLTEQEAS
jgi:chromosome segregation ATPase